MNENSDTQRTLSQTLASNPWLLFEVLTFLVLLSLILGYADFDAELKLLTRTFVVFFLSTALVGAVHVLAIERNRRQPLSCYVAYGFMLLRAFLIAALVCWLRVKALI